MTRTNVITLALTALTLSALLNIIVGELTERALQPRNGNDPR